MKNSVWPHSLAPLLILTIMVLAFQNCGSSEEIVANQTVFYDSAANEKEIQDLIDQELACAADADCEAIPIGNQACGGPRGYEVASRLNPAFEQIVQMADDLRQLEALQARSEGTVSTCVFHAPPTVLCSQGQCQTGE